MSKFKFKPENETNVSLWIQIGICSVILVIIAFSYLHPQKLNPKGRMKSLAESILHGDNYSKSNTLWELQNLNPVDGASLVNIVFTQIDNETPANEVVVQEYHKRNIALAGEFADFYRPKTVTIGDLAAFSIRIIRQNLITETAGDGGPVKTLAAVRNVIANNAQQLLCSGSNTIKVRILKEILLGDSDPSPINTVLSCCFNDTNPAVRAFSAALFISYSHVNRKSTFSAVPKLVDMVDDPDVRVSYTAQAALKSFSGLDFGSDVHFWKEWLAKYKDRYR